MKTAITMGEFIMLNTLVQQGRPRAAADLHELSGATTTRPATHHVLKKLASQGLVEWRTESEKEWNHRPHRRRRLWRITQKGRRVLTAYRQIIQ